jgi:hypothetical protein
MSNPTSNFNWQMPTNTDLVSQLPADFEVFGQAVDTSLADLKGGTTGQILAKNTNADMDFVWTTAAPGDITGVTAGTGISGGGTSGDVTITNSMATAIDAKGDLIAGTGADAFSRLAVGANATILTADSSEATGMKWATPAAPTVNFAGASVKNSSQSVANNTEVTLAFTSENFDTAAYHDNTTNNSRITIPAGKAGYYLVTGEGQYNSANSTGRREMYLLKNGSFITRNAVTPSTNNYPTNMLVFPIYLAVADYIQLAIYQTSGTTETYTDAVFTVSYLGA